jgi:hypothetical protein
MLASDDSDFYMGDHSIIDQIQQTTDIGQNDNQEIEKSENINTSQISSNCAVNQTKIKFKFLKIALHRGNPNFIFEINQKIYRYGLRGVKADFTMVLRCQKSICSITCFISPLEILKTIIQNAPKGSRFQKKLDQSDPKVYDIKNYDINSFEICGDHKCLGTDFSEYKNTSQISPSVVLDKSKINCNLLKIDHNRGGHPTFHFEIDEKIYFYGLRGVKADYSFILRCQKATCGITCFISPLEILKKIIQDAPKGSRFQKILDQSDPKVYDINNYDQNSFEICRAHKCAGTEFGAYFETKTNKCKILENPPSDSPPSAQITGQNYEIFPLSKNFDDQPRFRNLSSLNIKFEILKIQLSVRGKLIFHFEINKVNYYYGVIKIREASSNKILLQCTNKCSAKSPCSNRSFILTSENAKDMIKDPQQGKKSKFLDKSDPRVYDIRNYDLNSFEIFGNHGCPGINLSIYNALNEKTIYNTENDCKILDIFVNRCGNPNFSFEINGKVYFYGLRGVKANNQIVLQCPKSKCTNTSFISPAECLKIFIYNTPKYSQYPKMLDRTDPMVFDINNYDISSFDIGRGHKCAGTELYKTKVRSLSCIGASV